MKALKNDNRGNIALWIIGIIFSVIGCIFLIIGIVSGISTSQFMETAVPTEARINAIERYRDRDGDRHYDVYVTYTVDDITYEDQYLGYHSKGMREGDVVEIYYDPENPIDIVSGSGTFLLTYVFVGIGGVFFVVVLVSLISMVKNNASAKKLKQNGRKVDLPIARIEVNYNVSVNSIPGHKVVCANTIAMSGEPTEYESKNVFKFLDESMLVGKYVSVYVDRENPNKYFVDVNSIQL